MGECKAVHLQQVEEGISHHVRDAVIRLLQTASKPVTNLVATFEQSMCNKVAEVWSGKGRANYLLSQSQWDMVKMLLLKTPNSEWKDRMVCWHWSCSRQQRSVSENTPATSQEMHQQTKAVEQDVWKNSWWQKYLFCNYFWCHINFFLLAYYILIVFVCFFPLWTVAWLPFIHMCCWWFWRHKFSWLGDEQVVSRPDSPVLDLEIQHVPKKELGEASLHRQF